MVRRKIPNIMTSGKQDPNPSRNYGTKFKKKKKGSIKEWGFFYLFLNFFLCFPKIPRNNTVIFAIRQNGVNYKNISTNKLIMVRTKTLMKREGKKVNSLFSWLCHS